MTQGAPLDHEPRPVRFPHLSDDLAYILPMGIFLAFLSAGGHWPGFFVASYVLRTIATAVALLILWPRYTKIRWNGLFPGFVLGVIGTFQWIGMQLYLQNHFVFFKESPNAFDPFKHFQNHMAAIAFIVVRLTGAAAVVPFMEERFWRDFLWRQILAPNDFKLASIGEWSPSALFIVTAVFASVHGNWWLTAIVWGLLIGGLLVYTKSLGACIVCHATTNLLLGIYVLYFHAWSFW